MTTTAGTPISELPAVSSLDGTEYFPLVQGGVTKKATTQDVATLSVTGNQGLTNQILVGGGVGVPPIWTNATGSGAPARAVSPSFTTPNIGDAAGASLTLTTALTIANGGTGQTTQTEAFDALAPTTTTGDMMYYDGSNNVRLAIGTPGFSLKVNPSGTGYVWNAEGGGDALTTLPLSQWQVQTTSAEFAGIISDETGTGSLVFANTPTLVTPVLGTPTSGTLTNCTGLPVSTGVSGLGTGVATFLATPTSANLATAVTDETGSGSLVFATSPTLVTPILGTPTSGTLTNCTGYTVANISGLGTGVGAALALNVGAAGSVVLNGGVLGTPSSGTLTSCTGLPVSTGISGLGTGVATALAVNVGSAGAVVTFNGALGTPSSGTLTSCTGLPISTGVSGLGTGVATALAVNVGSAGAFVTFNGALGTPSSGTMTNVSGTAASLTAGQATAALGFKTASTTVSVSGATAPSSGQALVATSSTNATWQTVALFSDAIAMAIALG